jgi:hypothetical protein
MRSNTAERIETEVRPISVTCSFKRTEREVAGYTACGAAWQTELMQAKTTHGPMDIRLWRQVR